LGNAFNHSLKDYLLSDIIGIKANKSIILVVALYGNESLLLGVTGENGDEDVKKNAGGKFRPTGRELSRERINLHNDEFQNVFFHQILLG
jgi:hypothetical protein